MDRFLPWCAQTLKPATALAVTWGTWPSVIARSPIKPRPVRDPWFCPGVEGGDCSAPDPKRGPQLPNWTRFNQELSSFDLSLPAAHGPVLQLRYP